MNLDYQVKLAGETVAAFLCRRDAELFLEQWDIPSIFQRRNMEKKVQVEVTWKLPTPIHQRLVEAFGYNNVKVGEEEKVCKLFS